MTRRIATSARRTLPPTAVSFGIVLKIGLTSLIYFIIARLSLVFVLKPEGVAAIWPSSGIFLSSLLLTRRSHWPLLIAALCVADLTAELMAGTSLPVSCVYTAALAGEAALGAWLVRRFVGSDFSFARVKDVFAFLVFCVILSSGGMAIIAAAAPMVLLGSSFWLPWKWWWASDAVGLLLVTPAVLVWAKGRPIRPLGFNAIRFGEALLLYGAMAMANGIAFDPSFEQPSLVFLTNYLTFPFLIWAALRFGVRGDRRRFAASGCVGIEARADRTTPRDVCFSPMAGSRFLDTALPGHFGGCLYVPGRSRFRAKCIRSRCTEGPAVAPTGHPVGQCGLVGLGPAHQSSLLLAGVEAPDRL